MSQVNIYIYLDYYGQIYCEMMWMKKDILPIEVNDVFYLKYYLNMYIIW